LPDHPERSGLEALRDDLALLVWPVIAIGLLIKRGLIIERIWHRIARRRSKHRELRHPSEEASRQTGDE
jgi:hypothetical protein